MPSATLYDVICDDVAINQWVIALSPERECAAEDDRLADVIRRFIPVFISQSVEWNQKTS